MLKMLTFLRASILMLLLCSVCLAGEAPPGDAATAKAAPQYDTRAIEGWTVHISPKLLADDKVALDKALEMLAAHLKQIVIAVPADAVAHLKKVPLYFNPGYPGIGPHAEYHPDAGWLKANKRDPGMAHGVEFTNVKVFEADTSRMPVFVLHELAHAFHDQVLSFDQPDVIAAYKRALESKSYEKVERFHGVPGRHNTFERAYAMTNHKEYFAECTEAFFGRNDFFPFTRDQLEAHDPEMFKLLARLWNAPLPK